MDTRCGPPCKNHPSFEVVLWLNAQAFQSWNENCGEALGTKTIRLSSTSSAAMAFNQGGKQWKPQCAKSPQFLSTDRFQTSYSNNPSTSFASLPLFCHFLTVSSILCIRDGRKCTLCLFCVIHCALSAVGIVYNAVCEAALRII